MTAYIYKITNTMNGKVYVGSSERPKERRWHHFSSLRHGRHDNAHLQKDFLIYGEFSFRFEIIMECDASERDYNETKYIKLLGAAKRSNGYNLNGSAHGEQSEETLRYLSSVRRGRKHSKETRAKMSANSGARNKSAEWRAHLSQALKGKRPSEETCAALYAATKGKPLSPEHRAKVSAALKKSPAHIAFMERLHASKRGVPLSEEHKARIGAANKKRAALRKAGMAI